MERFCSERFFVVELVVKDFFSLKFLVGKGELSGSGGLSQKLGVAARFFLALPSRFLVCSGWHRKALSSSLGSMKFYFFLSQLVSFGCR